MRVLALSVFEGVIYHCRALDLVRPDRITLEVDAVLRPGDADATSGPLLLPVADYILMVGIDEARPHLRRLADRGRIVQHLGVDHIAFPTWTNVGPAPLVPAGRPTADGTEAADDDGVITDHTDAPGVRRPLGPTPVPDPASAPAPERERERDPEAAARTGNHPCLDPVDTPD